MADLQFTVSALDKATAALLKVAAQLDKVGDRLDKLDGKVARIAVALEGDKKAIAGLDNVERKVNDLDGKKARIKVDVDKSFGDSLVQINMVGKALKAIALPAAAIAAAPQLAALGAAAVQTSGSLLLLPAGALAAGAAIGTLAVAFNDFGTALYQGTSKTKIKEATAALAAMGPQARSTAMAIRDLKGPFEDLRKVVQEKFFAGMGAEIKQLGSTYFPLLKTGMAGIATEMNKSAIGFLDWAKSAGTVRGVSEIFTATRLSVHELAPAITNVAAGLLDMGVVGSKYLPMLAAHASNLTQKFRDWVTQAKESGKLDEWIQTGIVKVQQLGSIVGNVGSILMSVFSAASTSGADFLGTVDRITGGIANFLKSGEGQGAIVALFKEIRATVDALEPGVKAVGSALAYMIAQIAQSGTLHSAAGALSDMAISVAPLAKTLVDLATMILPPVLHLISAIAPVLGPVVAGFVAWSLASKGLAGIQGALGALATKMSDVGLNAGVMTEKLTGSANAGEKVAGASAKVSGALTKVGAALPAIGIAVVAIGLAYDVWGAKADEAAGKVLNGSLSLQAAIKGEGEQIHSNQIEWLGGMNAQESYAAAAKNVTAEIDKQRASMSPMQQLQSDVARAQADLNDAVAQFGPASTQAQVAGAALAAAHERLKTVSDGATAAEKSLGDQIVDTANAAAGAANADLGYQQSLMTLTNAQNAAAEAAKGHAAGSREVTQANLDVQAASLGAAAAAQRKAEADATAAGASNVAQIGAQAYKDELLRQAATMEGPNKQALIDLANGTNTAKQAAATAEIASRLYKDELQRLADKETGPVKAALEEGKRKLDEIAAGHGTAQQKADAQRAMLQRLADQTTGPTHAAIMGMINDLGAIPKETTFTVKGVGQVSYGSPELLRAAHGGHTGGVIGMDRAGLTGVAYADGGVTPGYTPGRDVHTFRSATGGTLELSGGEAVMRPEWTQAVSPDYVHAANKAARQGGVDGVMDFIARTAPRGAGEGVRGDGAAFAAGGIFGLPHQRFAAGGMTLTGTPFRSMPPQLFNTIAGSLVHTIQGTIEAAIKKLAAEAAAGVSGIAGGGAQAALNFARSQVGKPYVWGAVGPGGYDCSGFMSAITNVMRGQSPYRRVGATGSFPWAGFAPGLGGQLAIGAFRGNPGHMAGTLAPGVNVESSGGVGVRVGGGARGASNGMFNIRGHIGDRGGLLRHGEAALNLSGSLERVLSPPETQTYGRGRVDDALIAEVRGLRGELRALRGDVDHHGDNATIAGEIRRLGYQLTATGGSAAGKLQADRTQSELGAWA